MKTIRINATYGNDDDWVDMGLPSGVLWAKCNLGATKPEEYGDYYAWGEVIPKSVYDWGTYRYCTNCAGKLHSLIKYNTDSNYGTPDNLTILQAMDDAAIARLGNGVRIPTLTEWWELIDNTTKEWTNLNRVYGRKFTAPNGNSIFLPAAGYRSNTKILYDGRDGNYWSSSLHTSNPATARSCDFNSNFADMGHGWGFPRCGGLSVRAVCDVLPSQYWPY